MLRALWKELGIVEERDVRLELNSLGQPPERLAHRAALIAHFEAHAGQLDEDAKRRLHTNPLRILDSKNPAMQPLIEAAPKLPDFLGAESLAHFDAVRAVLDAAGLAYRINPRLVRGMDYYNLTVFEWITDKLGAQGTVCGGGRYDGLIEQLGGKPAPAAGFAMGIERLLALVEAGGRAIGVAAPDAYIVHAGDVAGSWAWRVAAALRAAGLSAVLHCGGGSFKSQMKKADASRARFAVILGDDEAAAAEVTLKPLREAAEQVRATLAQATDFLKKA
jgi:histidyl-tRNA synthetase